MIDLMIGLVVGIIVGTIASQQGYEVLRKKMNWYPAASDEIRKKLKHEGILEDFIEGKILCNVCQKPLTFSNLWSIMEDDENQDFLCRNPDCYVKYLDELHDLMVTDITS